MEKVKMQHYARPTDDGKGNIPIPVLFEVYTLRWCDGGTNNGAMSGIIRWQGLKTLEEAEAKVEELNNKDYGN